VTRVDRVTVDVDGTFPDYEQRALTAYYNLRASGAEAVEVRVSSSHEGIHLIAWYDERLGREARLRIRESVADDYNRVRMDHERGRHGHTTGVCWREKSSRDGEAFRVAGIDEALSYTLSRGLALSRWDRPAVAGREHAR
jgi:hypothetical protein